MLIYDVLPHITIVNERFHSILYKAIVMFRIQNYFSIQILFLFINNNANALNFDFLAMYLTTYSSKLFCVSLIYCLRSKVTIKRVILFKKYDYDDSNMVVKLIGL